MAAFGCARSLRVVACVLAVVLGFAQAASAQTSVSGPIVSDARWTKALSPYVVTGDVSVVSGAHLTIEPGVQVHFAAGRNLVVSAGALVAVGSAEAPIVFTSKNVLDGLPAARGNWGRIRFLDGNLDAETRLQHVVVEYGSGLEFVAASARLDHVTVQHNAGAAITQDLASSPAGVGNRALDNGLDAIVVPAGRIQGDVTWGVRGIQYLVASGQVEVGAAPKLDSVSPDSAQVDESVSTVFDGSRLTGLTNIRFDRAGIQATQPAPASANSARVDFVVAADATPGPVAITAMTDAGEVTLADAFTIQAAQPKLVAIDPAQVYLGQGNSTLTVTGTSLQSGTQVMLDETPLATTIVSPESATAIVPSQGTIGTRQVRLRTPDPAAAGTYFNSATLPLQVLSPTLALTPVMNNAQIGQVITLKVVLPFPAPAGGLQITLSSTNTTIASVPASVTVDAGATEADVPATAKALGTVNLRAMRAGYVMGEASLLVTPPPAIAVAPSIVSVAVDSTLTADIQLTPAPTQDAVVSLSSANPAVFTVPAQVTVPAGSASIAVPVTGVANGLAAMAASSPGYATGNATVRVSPKSILLPTSAVVAPGATRSLTVALNAPAPAGGLVVALASSNAAVHTVPASVTVAEGKTSVVVANVRGISQGTATLTASADGFAGATTQFTVRTISVYVYASSGIPQNFSTAINVQISEAAPAGGISVDLAVSDPALARIDNVRVDIPAGSTVSSFARPQLLALAPGSVRVTASAPGLTSYGVDVTLLPAPGITVYTGYETNPSPAVVGKGMQLRNGVYLSLGYPSTSAVTVNLVSSQPDKFTVPATVVVPANTTSLPIDVTGLQLTTSAGTITATAAGYDGTNKSVAVEVHKPVPLLYNSDSIRTVGGMVDDLFIQLSAEGAGYGSQYAAVPTSIALSLAAANPVGIVDGFHEYSGGPTKSEFLISVGGQYIQPFVGSPTALGSYQIKAEIPGGGSALAPPTQVVQPKLSFSYTQEKAVRGFTLNNYNLTIRREALGSSLNSYAEVFLTSSDPSKLQLPESVYFNYGASTVQIPLVGLANTEPGAPVLVSAVAAGYDSPVEKLAVDVIDPVFDLYVSGGYSLVLGQERSYFSLGVTNGNRSVYAVEPLQVSLGVGDMNPAGIVDGLYDSSSATASPLTSATIPVGSSSVYGYLGTPTATGSFRVQWQAAGYPAGSSNPITVGPGRLVFDSYYVQHPLTIGKSLAGTACVYLTNDVGNQVYAQNPIVVNLTSSDPAKLQVPAQATIPARNTRVCPTVAGLESSSGTPVTIDAASAGFISPTQKLGFIVAPVEWRLQTGYRCTTYYGCTPVYFMRSPVYTGEPNGVINLSPFIDGKIVGLSWGLADAQLPLSIIEDSPAGLVTGFYAQNGTTPTTTTLMSSTSYYSGQFYAGKATQPGSYRVQVQMPDGSLVKSDTVSVVEDRLTIGNANAPLQLAPGTQATVRVRRLSNVAVGDVISLACVDTTVCSVPATGTTRYDYYGSYVDVVVTGLAVGETILTASLPGVASAQVSVTVARPTARVDYLPSTMALGEARGFYVSLRSATGSYLTPSSPRTVTLSFSPNGVVSAPVTVAIPAGVPNVYFSITGTARGTTTITASEPGSDSSSGSITVN
jgi:hypothetical protein